MALAAILCAIPAKAEEMRAGEAQQFIAGKHFYYSCFEGTSGYGRIYADGSVAGYIQIGGGGPLRYVVLPAGTLRVRDERYCFSLRGTPFKPCFNVERTGHNSFRGSIAGFGFAHCNFRPSSAQADQPHWPLRLQRIRAESAVIR